MHYKRQENPTIKQFTKNYIETHTHFFQMVKCEIDELSKNTNELTNPIGFDPIDVVDRPKYNPVYF